MRTVTAITVLLTLSVAAAAQFPDWGPREHPCAHAKRTAAEHMIEHGHLPPEASGLARDVASDATDVHHYDLAFEVDFPFQKLTGSNIMTVESLIDGLTHFEFRLREEFTIPEIRVNDQVVTWNRLDADTVEIDLGATFNTGDVFSVYVSYTGTPPTYGTWGSIVFAEHSGVNQVWTLSQPWWSHTWWPVKDDNRDKATGDLRITVEDDYSVVANGLLLEVVDAGAGLLTYHWQTNYPTAPYLFAFAATNYEQHSLTWNYDDISMPLEFYIYPESSETYLMQFMLELGDMLTFFSDIYGVYPFAEEKFGVYLFGWGGGMEHQTCPGQGLLDATWLNAHELAHQWWGDYVTCATWNDIWLNEGAATYSEALWYESQGGPVWLHGYMDFRRPIPSPDTVYVYDATNQSRVFSTNTTYNKGAWVMHMLRKVLGDEAYFAGLATFRSRFAAGAATTEDFQHAMEDASGRELSWFFAQWVYSASEPTYYLGSQEITIDGQRYVELYVSQHPFLPLFTMPIDVAVVFLNETFELHTIWNDARSQHYLLPVESGEVIEEVLLDPWPWILRTVNTTGFSEGAPKVVGMTPAPDAAVPSDELAQLTITFHKDVNITAQDVALVGEASGAVGFTFSYDTPTQTATLDLGRAMLSPDRYTLTVSDAVADTTLAKQLDGELEHETQPMALPSGDGVPGGVLAANFVVIAPGTGDVNCDGMVDFGDIDAFVTAIVRGPAEYAVRYPNCDIGTADLNGDGQAGFADINPFVALILSQ